MSIRRDEYLSNRSVSNRTIQESIARSHNRWLADVLERNPMAEGRWKPLGNEPGDPDYWDKYYPGHADRVRPVPETRGAFEFNLLLPFALLAPSGVAMNSKAALDDFGIVADAVLDGTLSIGQELTSEALEDLSDKVHEGWLVRESWRRGREESFDRLDIPYAKLPEEEKDKDRARVRAMFAAISRDCPAE